MTKQLLFSLVLALMAGGGYASSAKACGGFFCNQSQPVNQSAERIIFSHNPDGTTTALIQIQYSGPSESFAWMLPVVGTPEISVSSNIAFRRLQQATNPSYVLNVEVEGECDQDRFQGFPGGGSDGSPSADAGASFDAGAPSPSSTKAPWAPTTTSSSPWTEPPKTSRWLRRSGCRRTSTT